MRRTSLNQKFHPSAEKMKNFSIREQEQLSIVIGANMIFICLFAVFGIVLFIFKYPVIGAGSLFLLAVFITSLVFIKKGKINLGTWITSCAIALLTVIVCFGSKFEVTNFLPYRDACFIAVMTFCNYIIAIKRKQLYAFFIFVMAFWVVLNIVMYRPIYQAGFAEALMNIVICTLGVITANTCAVLFDNFTRRVVDRASENEKKTTKAFEKITSVIQETKEGLNIGKELSSSTNKATKNVEEISNLYQFINQETTSLRNDATEIKGSSVEINNKADKMKSSISDQNMSISQTSASLNQMSTSITNINKIATQQHQEMNEIIQNLDSQMQLLQKLAENVGSVKESSKKVSNFVEAVNTIAAQTGLLAMNASIEAAHAGTLGKGFSVIAQEIRKLSVETTKNAENITETLKENENIVNTTSESMISFSEYTKTTTEKLRDTISVIEEILSGISEIDVGTNDVMQSLNQIVDTSNTNTQLAEGVAGDIIKQNEAIESISTGTQTLQSKVSNLEQMLENIRIAIDEINANASANEVVAEKISGVLG
ncbi:MAG: hypothetical protein K6G52_04010 [Treponemataceae bacterium]|nr:hypothetical protein [Treponemataceae bacterium]